MLGHAMQHRKPLVLYTSACRERMEAALATTPAGVDRLRQSDERITSHMARMLEKHDEERAAKRSRLSLEEESAVEGAEGAEGSGAPHEEEHEEHAEA